jgi:hypothetical protein
VQWHRELTWNPSELGWRIAALFMTGALIFALGSFPPYSQLVDGRIVGITFVIGSLFFTSAGYSQFLQVINSPDDDAGASPESFRFWAWQPARVLWWATFVQLIGTLLFNVSTIDAMRDSLTVEETNRLVWAPDFLGSISFLIASHLGWTAVCHRLWCVRRDDSAWWGALLNYVGSIFFMLAAIASFTLETTGEALNITIVNIATFAGAICFFVGAYLLLPAVEDDQDPAEA